MGEPYEVQYWKKKFGVTGQALAGAIRATGSNSVKKVETYLKGKKWGKGVGRGEANALDAAARGVLFCVGRSEGRAQRLP